MAKVLVVYHTQSGNTEEMAKAVAEGATSTPGTEVILKKAADTTADDVVNCDAVAFGSAVYWQYMAGALKEFYDCHMMHVIGKVPGKPYAAFSSVGRGGTEAIDAIQHICERVGMRKACDSVVANMKPSDEALNQCKELGKNLASCQPQA